MPARNRYRQPYRKHAWEAVQMAPSGREVRLAVFPVTASKPRPFAKRQAENRCRVADGPTLVREINTPGPAGAPGADG